MTAIVRRESGAAKLEVRIPGLHAGADSHCFAGGDDAGATPQELLAASLASSTALTIELYARRKGWELAELEVDVDYSPAHRGFPTRCATVVRLPESLSPEQRERLMQVGVKSQVHRTLEGEILFAERVELTSAQERPEKGANEPHRPRPLFESLRGVLSSRSG